MIAITLRLVLVPEPEEIGYIVADDVVSEKVVHELRKMSKKTKDAENRKFEYMNATTETDSVGKGGRKQPNSASKNKK